MLRSITRRWGRWAFGSILLALVVLLISGEHAHLLGTSSSEIDLTRGLIGYWQFDEGKGDVAKDSSGNGFDGTIDGAKWVEGRLGKALQFDGLNARVEVPQTNSLSILQQITLAAWVKLLGPADQGLQGLIGADGFASGYRLLIRDDSKVIQFQLTAKNGFNLLTTSRVTTNTWYHVVATYDGSTMRMHINGVKDPNEKARTGPIDPNQLPLVIGKPQFALNGIIDDVRIYNRALNEEEIKALFQLGSTQGNTN